MDKQTKSWKEIEKKLKELKNTSATKELADKKNPAEILKKRADIMAISDEKKEENGELINVLKFTLGQENYAIKTNNLKEVLNSSKIQEIPCTPDYIYGILNYRGKITSVIDLKRYLDLDYVGINDLASIILVEYEQQYVGFVVDEILGIKNIPVRELSKMKSGLKNIKDHYLIGVSKSITIVLDIIALLSDKAIIIDESV